MTADEYYKLRRDIWDPIFHLYDDNKKYLLLIRQMLFTKFYAKTAM